ncbi:hypothetical protein [Mesorhizobium sp. M1A.F.Ca.ET.072.01.1.1]|uniref:DinB/UmuC family translesion DNA polymerase n=1 Tax=Mesorhizobium sp. M1A.F.Ca.ET.072.01.1.1 TaxID=2496753 RepID=UPI001FDF45CB|nr:hypothetical protein [Mesorhizobium sp. M1A.F.Ca.ET.072.01.1.1]
MRAITRSTTLDAPISATVMLAEIAEELVRVALADHPGERIITLLDVSVSHLRKQPDIHLDLPLGLPNEKRRPGARKGIARWTADRAIDTIRVRFGRDAVGWLCRHSAGRSALGSRRIPRTGREGIVRCGGLPRAASFLSLWKLQSGLGK